MKERKKKKIGKKFPYQKINLCVLDTLFTSIQFTRYTFRFFLFFREFLCDPYPFNNTTTPPSYTKHIFLENYGFKNIILLVWFWVFFFAVQWWVTNIYNKKSHILYAVVTKCVYKRILYWKTNIYYFPLPFKE